MPLIGIPDSVTPELLYGLAKMGHGDTLVIADEISLQIASPKVKGVHACNYES